MNENEDYELITGDGDYWNIRIKTGKFVETVFSFGSVALNSDNESLNFSLDIVSTPDADLTVDDIDFQRYCGDILQSVLSHALEHAESHIDETIDEVDTDESQY